MESVWYRKAWIRPGHAARSDRRMEENLNKPEATASMAESESQMPILLGFLVDRTNILILLRLSSGNLAIYFSLTQNFPAAIIAMLWAVPLGWHRRQGLSYLR